MTAMVSLPAIDAFATHGAHPAHGAAVAAGLSTQTADPLGAGTTPAWGLGFINSAVSQKTLQTAMGRPFAASGLYAPLSGWNYPTDPARQVAANGGLLYLNINSWKVVGGKKICYPFSDVAAGEDDALLQNWATQIAAFDYANTIITFTHEPTVVSQWQPGCGSPADYVAAFHYVHQYFMTHGVTYPWTWTMVASSFKVGYADSWQPSAQDFQWVGVDGYNRFSGGFWRTPEYTFTAAHNYAVGLGKPLMMGEIGTVEDPADSNRKSAWFTDATNLFNSWGDVAAILWNDSQDFRPDSSTKTLNAWADLSTNSGEPYLSGTNGTPGQTVTVWGTGYGAGETVDMRLDSPTGTVLASPVANADGVVSDVQLQLPMPLAGGNHALYASGETSGTNAQSTVDVAPPEAARFRIAAGDTWTYNGVGWVPGENVSVSFPGASAVRQIADGTGSVSIIALSPPEPAPGDKVTISAPSFATYVTYHVITTVTVPGSSQPRQQVPVSGTGYGPGEIVNVEFNGKATTQSFTTNAQGSFSGQLLLDLPFGRHQVSLAGAVSHMNKRATIRLAATMSMSPTSGPVGSTITINSGPGWIAGETVDLKIGSKVIQNLTADANGRAQATTVMSKHAPGTINLHLTGVTSKQTATAPFRVTGS